MHKFRAITVAAIMACVFIFSAVPAFASASPTNLGQCHAITDLHREQAPGRTGNGPLIINANGDLILAQAFEGGQGCTKS